jgi:hypothetical protein
MLAMATSRTLVRETLGEAPMMMSNYILSRLTEIILRAPLTVTSQQPVFRA